MSKSRKIFQMSCEEYLELYPGATLAEFLEAKKKSENEWIAKQADDRCNHRMWVRKNLLGKTVVLKSKSGIYEFIKVETDEKGELVCRTIREFDAPSKWHGYTGYRFSSLYTPGEYYETPVSCIKSPYNKDGEYFARVLDDGEAEGILNRFAEFEEYYNKVEQRLKTAQKMC